MVLVTNEETPARRDFYTHCNGKALPKPTKLQKRGADNIACNIYRQQASDQVIDASLKVGFGSVFGTMPITMQVVLF